MAPLGALVQICIKLVGVLFLSLKKRTYFFNRVEWSRAFVEGLDHSTPLQLGTAIRINGATRDHTFTFYKVYLMYSFCSQFNKK